MTAATPKIVTLFAVVVAVWPLACVAANPKKSERAMQAPKAPAPSKSERAMPDKGATPAAPPAAAERAMPTNEKK